MKQAIKHNFLGLIQGSASLLHNRILKFLHCPPQVHALGGNHFYRPKTSGLSYFLIVQWF